MSADLRPLKAQKENRPICIERACGRRLGVSTFGGAAPTFGGRSNTPESKNRMTAVMLSGLSGVSGVFDHPLPQFRGGGVFSHVRVVRATQMGGELHG